MKCRCVHAHAGMRGLHVLARIVARSAAGLADLVDQFGLETGEPGRVGNGGLEEAVDPVVAADIGDKLVNHRDDGGLSAEPRVERLLFGDRGQIEKAEAHQSHREEIGEVLFHGDYP